VALPLLRRECNAKGAFGQAFSDQLVSLVMPLSRSQMARFLENSGILWEIDAQPVPGD
jgi:hypothetical protein